LRSGETTAPSKGEKPTEAEQISTTKQRIKDTYGVSLDNEEGLKALHSNFGNTQTLEDVRKHVSPKDWTLKEVQDVELTLKRYGPLLGTSRPKELGAQTITSISRAKQKVVRGNDDSIVDKPTVLGTTFHGQKNVTMFDRGITNPKDFKTGEQQFRGTLAHEFAHALVQHKPVDPSKASSPQIIDQFVQEMDYWDSILVSNYASPKEAKTAKVEAPISSYGATNAKEDLADTMKFFFEDPQKLRDTCPRRFRFIYDNLKDSLDQTFITETIEPLKNW
ncbi:MAG: hypothetical protein HGA65_02495, partial [Oscillochloris sp.]|nr:hypothetical protein [Oscillochloris sp.]